MDKNQTIGFALIFLLMLVYFYMMPEPQPPSTIADPTPDSTEQVIENQTEKPLPVLPDSLQSAVQQATWGIFATGIKGSDQSQTHSLENDDVKITFSTEGGRVREVILKKYLAPDGNPVVLLNAESSRMQWLLPTTLPQGDIDMGRLHFELIRADTRALHLGLTLADGKKITQKYRLDPTGYILKYDLDVSDLKPILKTDALAVRWRHNLRLQEPSMEISRRYATVSYFTVGQSFDQLSEAATNLQEETLEEPIQWLSMKQRFFSASLITSAAFEQGHFTSVANEADTAVVKALTADFSVPLQALTEAGNLRYYFGPNEFYTMREVAPGFEENVYLGWAVFGLISRYVVLPLFTFLEGFISNYGLLIVVMVILIKLALSPLTYRSYFAQAKTKFIQPELAQLDEKYGEDKQTAQQEKLKLMTQVGANPMLGCIPALLQMPILFALFMFFPVLIYLRGEPFLWASDLSNYDSIINLPFSIPFYGAHVSLFTLLMAGGQLASVFVTGQTPATPQNSPINMKFMMYMMPFMLLFFFNSYPSGLNLYYFVSTAITILITLAIRAFFINEEKIAAIIERNRKKNAGKKSGFMARLEEAQKAQQEAATKRRQKPKPNTTPRKRK
ncbi:MAG: membrane protein insertase YidC [Bernardetiaceae bacterium]